MKHHIAPKLHPTVGFFWTMIFHNLKFYVMRAKTYFKFTRILWPSQNIWTLPVLISDHFVPRHSKNNLEKANHRHQAGVLVELVSKELNHFGVIAGFQQIVGHSSRFVLFSTFWRLFTIKMIKSVKVFPFSFRKIMKTKKNHFIKFKPPA